MASVKTDMQQHPLSVTVPVATQLLGFKDTKSIYTLIRQGKISYKSLEDYIEGC